MYDLNSDKELNGDFRTEDHNNDSDNDNKKHTHVAKEQPIKKNKNNKPSSPTVKEKYLKATHNKETNK